MTRACNPLAEAEAIYDWLCKRRRYLNRHPELSRQEQKTARYCRQELKALGYELSNGWGYGFFADLKVAKPRGRVAFRCDMDALPVDESLELDYCAFEKGAAHLCGHDLHMAILLGVGRLLAEYKSKLHCDLRLIFQPCEEQLPGGAIGMIERNCLEGVDEIYAIHNDPQQSVGQLSTRNGQITANADAFELEIIGRACQAEMPHLGLDPIMAAAELVAHWQHLVSRRFAPDHGVVLSVTQLHAGDSFNSLAQTVHCQGIVRTYTREEQQKIEHLIRSSLYAYEAQGYRIEFRFIKGYPAVENHPQCVERIAQAAGQLLTEGQLNTQMSPYGSGDDFSYYLHQIPGAMLFLGSSQAEFSDAHPLHSPHYQVDERCMPLGCALLMQLALDFKKSG
ncbi:M20 metallopeptidase family protein [Dongshaea marina]|uniref:M20 metallopeptidase family protein n=1 Tax=Dongshaea marina TaxID=2047966 RepID=UPI000D3EC16C|nr:M20 family metallopeptidase [Dongshaea marina]